MLTEILEWMTKWEPVWLFLVLFPEAVAGIYAAFWIKREYDYDERKDLEKKQRKTRTTKKTTTQPGGSSVVEEQTEITEPIEERKDEKSS